MQMFLMFSILFHKDILNEEIRLAYLFKDIITLYQGRKNGIINSNAAIQRYYNVSSKSFLKCIDQDHGSIFFLSLVLFYQKIYGADRTNVLRKFRDNN